MPRSLLLLLILPLFGCEGTVVGPLGAVGGGGLGVPGAATPTPEPTPVFDRDGMTIDFEATVDGADVELGYLISYWANLDNNVLNCEQPWSVRGTIAAAPTGCPRCSARIVLLPDTASDDSQPLQRGQDCDPSLIAAAQSDIGRALLTPLASNGLADLLELSWLPASAHQEAGGSLDAAGTFDFAFMQQVATSLDRVYEGVILLNDLGGLSTSISLPDVSGDLSGGSGWSPFFFLLRDPQVNDYEGPDLQGRYEAQGVFSVGFAAPQ